MVRATLVAILLASITAPASAQGERLPSSAPVVETNRSLPIDGSFGVTGGFGNNMRLGAEVEMGLRGTPLQLGALVWQPLFGGELAQTAWGGYAVELRKDERLRLLVGGTRYQPAVGCIDPCSIANHGLLLGASYLIKSERLWFQVTPQYLFALDGSFGYPSWAMSGLPWIEFGVPIFPGCDLSFRLGENLIKVAYRI